MLSFSRASVSARSGPASCALIRLRILGTSLAPIILHTGVGRVEWELSRTCILAAGWHKSYDTNRTYCQDRQARHDASSTEPGICIFDACTIDAQSILNMIRPYMQCPIGAKSRACSGNSLGETS